MIPSHHFLIFSRWYSCQPRVVHVPQYVQGVSSENLRRFLLAHFRTDTHTAPEAQCAHPAHPLTFTPLSRVWRAHAGINLEDITQYTLGTPIARGTG